MVRLLNDSCCSSTASLSNLINLVYNVVTTATCNSLLQLLQLVMKLVGYVLNYTCLVLYCRKAPRIHLSSHSIHLKGLLHTINLVLKLLHFSNMQHVRRYCIKSRSVSRLVP